MGSFTGVEKARYSSFISTSFCCLLDIKNLSLSIIITKFLGFQQ